MLRIIILREHERGKGVKGGGGWVNPLKKNSWRKSFLQIILNEVLKICEKWYMFWCKLIKTTRNIRSGGALSYKFFKDACSKLEIKYKRGIYFSFDFGWYSVHFDIVHQGFGMEKDENRADLCLSSILFSFESDRL